MSMKKRSFSWIKALHIALFGITVASLLAACSSVTTTQTQQIAAINTPTQQSGNPAPQTTSTANHLQTSCPATGTARALVLSSLTTTSHQTLVYIVNEFQQHTPTFGTLKRYDLTSGTKTEIIKLAHVSIDAAQVSADGQWLLFVSNTGTQQKLQAIRLDGQDLQTLYCSTTLQFTPQWSTNQQLIAFEESNGNTFSIFLLHVVDGTLEKVFVQSNAGPYAYLLRSWLDTTHLYLVRTTTDSNPTILSLLDLSKGDHQTPADLTQIVPAPTAPQNLSLGSFDSSYNGTQLFVNHNNCSYSCTGPSDITVQPALGGTQHTIFSSAQDAVTSVRTVTTHTLLLTIENHPFIGGTVDQSHNGLWTLQTDGTGLTRLLADSAQNISYLNASSQFPWSNLARDNTMYAVTQISTQQGQIPTVSILIGSLQGGTPTTIASISDGTALSVAGWTTL